MTRYGGQSGYLPALNNVELREDFGVELREDGTPEWRE